MHSIAPYSRLQKTKEPIRMDGELLARFVCIFAPAWEGQKLRSRSHRAGIEQVATGHLHLDGSNLAQRKKNQDQKVLVLFWSC